MVTNTGVAFGLRTPLWLILATFISLVGFGLWSWHKDPTHFEKSALALALILGGALSNLLDRAFHGFVLDYIDLKIWPVFNLADGAIFVGALILLWYALGPQVHSKTSNKKSDTSHVKTIKAIKR